MVGGITQNLLSFRKIGPGSTVVKFFLKNRLVILYGAALAGLLFLLKWLEFRFLIIDHSFEVYIGAIALIFTTLGIWLALKLTKPKIETVVVEKEVYVSPPKQPGLPDEQRLQQLGISKREWEVLALMSEGLSNQEIASRLFVSVNTIKTHSSKIFEKLDVRRRTQAIEKGKRLGLLA
jgi:two-component system, NarL family, response regulator LiaR